MERRRLQTWAGKGELAMEGVHGGLPSGPAKLSVSLFHKVPWCSCSALHLCPLTAPPSATFLMCRLSAQNHFLVLLWPRDPPRAG